VLCGEAEREDGRKQFLLTDTEGQLAGL